MKVRATKQKNVQKEKKNKKGRKNKETKSREIALNKNRETMILE